MTAHQNLATGSSPASVFTDDGSDPSHVGYHTPQSDVSSVRTPQAQQEITVTAGSLSSTTSVPTASSRLSQPAFALNPRYVSGAHNQRSTSSFIPSQAWYNSTGQARRETQAAAAFMMPQNPVGGFRTPYEQIVRPAGVIGERRASVDQEGTSVPDNGNHAQISAGGMHRLTGPVAELPPFDMSNLHHLPSIGNPFHYQPMFSRLLASGATYHPSPSEMNPDHPYNRGGLDDMLLQKMQSLAIKKPENGPVNHVRRHFSPHYQGDIFLTANQSENIPEDANCSLFIVNLPPNVTTHELLAAIHRMGPLGRIFAIHINAPEPQRNHPGCAAKVVFFKRDVAFKFYNLCELNGFLVQGFSARVMWNRIKTSEKPHLAKSDASRVLLVGGPPGEVNAEALTNFFQQKLEFQVDRILTHVRGVPGKEDAVIEYRFGSFRCQAQAAKMALAREKPYIRCFFAKDPLEPEAYKPFEYFNFVRAV